MNTSKGTETTNEEGAVEIINVETVDYRKPAGQDKESEKENVEITHVIRPEDDKPGPTNFVADAAGKVAEKLQSAKEAVSEYSAGGNKEDEKK
ncbi:hypothetical protein ACS0TY_025836 [Phlomoides rotata]